MKKILFTTFLFSISSPPVYAGQPVITETETGITVEYTGDPEIAPAATNGKGVFPELKPPNPSASEKANSISQGSQDAASGDVDAWRKQREEQRAAARAARRGNREPRGNEGN
jgi:hypothetical protein